MNHALASGCLIANVLEEMAPVFCRHVLIHELGGSLNGSERRFEFVGEGLNVLLRMLTAFERFDHGMQGIGERVDLASQSDFRLGTPFATSDGAGVVGELADGTEEPDEDGSDEHENTDTDEDGGEDDIPSSFLNKGKDIGLCLADADAPDNLPVFVNGRTDKHDRGVGVVFVSAGRTGSVFARQSEFYVAESGKVFALVFGVTAVE